MGVKGQGVFSSFFFLKCAPVYTYTFSFIFCVVFILFVWFVSFLKVENEAIMYVLITLFNQEASNKNI